MSRKQKHTAPTAENHYAWAIAWESIDAAVDVIDRPPLDRAWAFAQKVIEAQSEMYQPHVGRTVAIAMAWEDLEIAFRGFGQPGIGGAVFHLWSRIPDEFDDFFHQMVHTGFTASVAATDPNVLRYDLALRRTPIATLSNGFGKGEAETHDSDYWENMRFPAHSWETRSQDQDPDDTIPVVGRPARIHTNRTIGLTVVDGGKLELNPVFAGKNDPRKG